jgi:hypothetical protein
MDENRVAPLASQLRKLAPLSDASLEALSGLLSPRSFAVGSFSMNGELTGSLLDLLSDEPAVTFIQALEETHTLSFEFARFDVLCTRSSELQSECSREAAAVGAVLVEVREGR